METTMAALTDSEGLKDKNCIGALYPLKTVTERPKTHTDLQVFDINCQLFLCISSSEFARVEPSLQPAGILLLPLVLPVNFNYRKKSTRLETLLAL